MVMVWTGSLLLNEIKAELVGETLFFGLVLFRFQE